MKKIFKCIVAIGIVVSLIQINDTNSLAKNTNDLTNLQERSGVSIAEGGGGRGYYREVTLVLPPHIANMRKSYYYSEYIGGKLRKGTLHLTRAVPFNPGIFFNKYSFSANTCLCYYTGYIY